MPETSPIPADLQAALAGHYDLLRLLGRGGMASVYLAYDKKHQRDVALKVLLPGLAEFLGAERFLKEIEIAAHLTHPHILALHDSGEAGGFLYYVMPYIDGGSLRQQIAGGRRLSAARAFAIAEPVADALGYAHKQGILHRDIKPENILFSQGHPVVADFGIAKAVSTAGGTNLTRTGFPIGTPGYMSPEQAAGPPRKRCAPAASSKPPPRTARGSPRRGAASKRRWCGGSPPATTSAPPRPVRSWTSSAEPRLRDAATARVR